MEIFAKALPCFGDLILIEDDADNYGKHDLVADLLLSHHDVVFRHLKNLPVSQFIEIYQKVNGCGHQPETVDVALRHPTH